MSTSRETKQAVLDAISKWKSWLGLQDWAVQVRFDEELEEHTVMRSVVDASRASALIQVRPNVEEMFYNYLTLEKTGCHELIHCVVSDLLETWDLLSKSSMRKDEAEIIYAALQTADEHRVTRLCHLFWQAYETTPWALEQELPTT